MRSRRKIRSEQHAALGASPAYASARTRLAEAQTRRIDQLRLRDERQLIEARAAHLNLDGAVYTFFREACADVSRLLVVDVKKMADK